MTGAQWDQYFKSLSSDKRRKIFRALLILDGDPTFKEAFGSSFKELAFLIANPVKPAIIGTEELYYQRVINHRYFANGKQHRN